MKRRLGLDLHESQSWQGCHHPVILGVATHAFLMLKYIGNRKLLNLPCLFSFGSYRHYRSYIRAYAQPVERK